MKKYFKVYVLINPHSYGCGDKIKVIELLQDGGWGRGTPHPAFSSEEKAWDYIEEHGLRAEVMPLEVQEEE